MEEKCWFGVYLKFFEISKELIKGKIVRLIEKRGCGFSNLVQEGVELCCESYNSEPISLKWKEGGRVFKLELRSNNVGKLLQCSVLSSEGKRFSLIFLEGRGVGVGWKTLVRKLRSIGVVLAKFSLQLP